MLYSLPLVSTFTFRSRNTSDQFFNAHSKVGLLLPFHFEDSGLFFMYSSVMFLSSFYSQSVLSPFTLLTKHAHAHKHYHLPDGIRFTDV